MIAKQSRENPMTETMTVNYKEDLESKTVSLIENLLEDNYGLEGILEFIEEHSENDFREYYEIYVSKGEDFSYEAVDAFIAEFGIQCLESFNDSYQGEWESKADYAREYVDSTYTFDLPDFLEIDWEKTFENLDVVYSEGFVSSGFVFSKNF